MKKSSLVEAIKCRLEADKYAFDAEKNENFEFLKLSDGLKRAVVKKQTWVLFSRSENALQRKKKHTDTFFTYHFLFELSLLFYKDKKKLKLYDLHSQDFLLFLYFLVASEHRP